MGERTLIAWCDSTLNLEMGCDGCELWTSKTRTCYAGTMTEAMSGRPGWPLRFERAEVFPARIVQAYKWRDLTGTQRRSKPWLDGLPRLIFLNDMGDTFTESLRLDWLADFLPDIERSPHCWLVLTKRPRRAREFFEGRRVPKNMWLGTSVTDQRTARARISELARIRAPVRFVSFEPLLGPIDVGRWSEDKDVAWVQVEDGDEPLLDGIHWAIVGGESGSAYRPMDPAWARAIRDACFGQGVAFFYKQSSGPRSEMDPVLDGVEWRQMPAAGLKRQHRLDGSETG